MAHKKYLVSFVPLAAIIFALAMIDRPPPQATRSISFRDGDVVKIVVKNVLLTAEVAASPLARARGLSNHPGLGQNQAMLFIFNPPDRPMFWMNQMRFAIDIIWIRNGRIIDITHDLPPPSDNEFPATAQPGEEVDLVLEVPANTAMHNEFDLGDTVRISNF